PLRLDAHSMEFKSREVNPIRRDHNLKLDSPSSGHSTKDKTVECTQCASLGITTSLFRQANLGQAEIRMAMRDSDGNLWIATREDGVVRVARPPDGSSHSLPEID